MGCYVERCGALLQMVTRAAIAIGIVVTEAQTAALAQKASLKEMECHAEATKRYIKDFRQVGPVNQEAQENVVVLVNGKLNYEAYYSECLGRWNSIKVR
jgi:hypothetical protein